MNQWQLIDTAPMDGTAVLGFRSQSQGKTEGSNYQVTRWKAIYSSWFSIPGHYAWKPTHWMPLPDPPQGQP